jgi:flagellar motor switch protein FliG
MGIEEIKNAKEEARKVITRLSQKVAALLIALGPSTASEILKNIKDDDLLEQLTLDIANLGKVPDEDLNDVLNEFKAVFQAKNFVASGGVNYAKQLLAQAYGDAEASKMLEKVNSMVKTQDGMAKVLKVDVLRERIEAQIQIDDSIVDKIYSIGEFELKNAPQENKEDESDDDSDVLITKE